MWCYEDKFIARRFRSLPHFFLDPGLEKNAKLQSPNRFGAAYQELEFSAAASRAEWLILLNSVKLKIVPLHHV